MRRPRKLIIGIIVIFILLVITVLFLFDDTVNLLGFLNREPQLSELANQPLTLTNASGAVIGQGNFVLRAPTSLSDNQTALIELTVNIIPIAATPSGTQSSPTPTDDTTLSGVQLYERMGASLLCASERFGGCNTDEYDEDQMKLLSQTGQNTWTWHVAPIENTSGHQELEVKVWRLLTINDTSPQRDDVWTQRFSIEIVPTFSTLERTPILVAAIAALGALAVAVVKLMSGKGEGK